MNYIIYDLEWNQPDSPEQALREPVYLSGEIIEIGAVKLDENFAVTDTFKAYVTPQCYTRLHSRIVALTGIHDRDLSEKGRPFPEVWAQFTHWCGSEYSFMTWSMSDLPVLIENLLLHKLDITLLPVCYDIQRIFSREIMNGDTRYALDSALAILKIKGEPAHDALNDAKNTAAICQCLPLEEHLQEYASQVFAEEPGSVIYENRQAALTDPQLKNISCPWCGGAVSCEAWLQFPGGSYMAYGECEDGAEFLLQLTLHRIGTDAWITSRILFELSDDLWDVYMDRKERIVGV